MQPRGIPCITGCWRNWCERRDQFQQERKVCVTTFEPGSGISRCIYLSPGGGDPFSGSGFHFWWGVFLMLSPGFRLIHGWPSFSSWVCISASLAEPVFLAGCGVFFQELTPKVMVIVAGISSSMNSPSLFPFTAVVLIIRLHLIVRGSFLLGS